MTVRKYLLVGASLAVAVAALALVLAQQLTPTSAAGPLTMTISASGTGVNCTGSPQTSCTMPTSTTFKLSVNAVTPPAEGYITYQDFIDYQAAAVAGVTYTLAPAADEIVWPDGTGFQLGGQVCHGVQGLACRNHGASTGIIPPFPVSHFTGVVTTMSFTCSSSNSSTALRLAPSGDTEAGTDGSLYVKPDASQVVVKEHDLTIVCGAGGGPSPTPPPPTATATSPGPTATSAPPTATATTGPTATSGPPTATRTSTATSMPPTSTATQAPNTPTRTRTPTPMQVLGDVNRDGVVDSEDAFLILQHECGLATLPNPSKGDINGDGRIDSIDALFALWIDAGML